MDTKVQEFVTKYQDQPNVGDTTENKGQCVGLVEVWTDSLGLPHTWGNAKDLLADADTTKFDVVYNTPDNFPVVGDVVVFGETYGGGVGHTGVCVKADANTLTLFEQNDPAGSYPHTKDYTFDDCLGWLHPKEPAVVDAPAQPTTDTSSTSTYKGLDLTNVDSVKAAIDAWSDVANGVYVKKEEYDTLQAKITQLEQENADLNTKLNDLHTEHVALQDTHAEVQATTAAQTKEGLTQQIFDFLKSL